MKSSYKIFKAISINSERSEEMTLRMIEQPEDGFATYDEASEYLHSTREGASYVILLIERPEKLPEF